MDARSSYALEWCGQRLELLADRAIFWVEKKMLLIADPHFGKSATFRTYGIPVPPGVTTSDLSRLSTLLQHTQAERLMILGDFFHAKSSQAPETLAALSRWRKSHPTLHIQLIRGNHDRHAGDPPLELGIEVLGDGWQEAPFSFCHEPEPLEGFFSFAGHVHPAVSISSGGEGLRAPCFAFSPEIALLPAFGSFTGSWTIQPGPNDLVFLLGPDCVVPLSQAHLR